MTWFFVATILFAVLILVGSLIYYFTMATPATPSTLLTPATPSTLLTPLNPEDCINLFINKLRSFAQTSKIVDTHSITGEITDYNHFCQSIDAGISVNCPDLDVTMAIYGLHENYYENLRPEPTTYKNGQPIQFINDNGTIRPPDEYKLLNCRGIPDNAVFQFVLKHDDLSMDVAFEISIPDFMGKVSTKN